MGTGNVLFITLGLVVLIGIIIQFFLWKNRKKDKETLNHDWANFKRAIDKNATSQIILFGEKLVWNKYLTRNQLTEMIDVVNQKLERNPQLKELSLDLFNKKLHYDRTLPYPGSSGGIKQSW